MITDAAVAGIECRLQLLDDQTPDGFNGARGIGEFGVSGIAPAISAAAYYSTGVRVRELPVHSEDLLQCRQTSRFTWPVLLVLSGTTRGWSWRLPRQVGCERDLWQNLLRRQTHVFVASPPR
jgi:hypothetical protein